MNIESGCLARVTTNVMFGTPREMTHAEIIETIQQFIDGARQAYLSGFKGVELHGAHGYLIAQFLSPKVNLRTDVFGGTPAKRAEIVLRIIEGIRTTTSPQFCVGIKMNSVDVSEQGDGGLDACLEQMGLVVEAGIDFIEISGGSFENFSFLAVDPPADAMTPPAGLPIRKKSTIEREAYFLDFAKKVRKRYPEVPLMVTGGFRSRTAMEASFKGGACDIIGIGRPATMVPALPRLVLLNKELSDEEAKIKLKPVNMGWLMSMVPIKALGAGAQSNYYGGHIRRMGLQPADKMLYKSMVKVRYP
jgi:2,4-dienoyl-CoA reductase-like NADH-dependent reductase (Old Yellow Enzyme family)